MAKDILFGKGAMEKMLKGLDTVADAVSGTMGPCGLNVYYDDPIQPKITNDGVTIANKIVLEDKQEDAGAYVIRNVSSQQNDDVGDGTTTVSLLTQAIVHEFLKRPENAMAIRLSLKEAGDKILKILSKKSVGITKKDIEKVALISAENKELAKLITEIVNKLGEKAVINVEDSKTFATDYEIVDGYEAPVGFMSPHFINDKKAGKAIYSDIPVLATERKISNIQDIKPIFDQLKKENINSCVIACDDIEDAMLGVFVMNKNLGTFNALVIRASGEILRDIEGVTGAVMISASGGVTFQNFKTEYLGHAKKVVCDASKTLFIGDGASSKKYALTLERAEKNETNIYLKKRFKDRIARLRGGIAVLRVGAPTDLEREYLKMKAEDAVKATTAALEEGIVEGGGMAFWRIAQELKPKTVGEEILKKTLTAPLRKIIENAGKDYTEVISNLPTGKGYDAKTDSYVNMVEAGLIDPSKVERCALENAVSAASTFCTTFCTITEHVEPKTGRSSNPQ